MILLVIFGASTLPNRGKHVTQHGQARYPKWADFIYILCPKVYHESGFIFRPVSIALWWWTTLLSLIYLFRGVGVSLVCDRDTNQKMKYGWNWLYTDRSFTDQFFEDVELMIIGFWFGFNRICKCWGTSFFLSQCFLDKNLDKHTSSENITNTHPAKKSYSEYGHQPPPSLPRRGGTDTLAIDKPLTIW